MNKIFRIICAFMLLFLNVTPCKADNISVTKYFLENGDYLEIELIQDETDFLARSSRTTSGSKKVSYKKGSTVLWSVSVKGTFTYDGDSAICINANVSTTCPSKAWKISNSSASKSLNKAIASATAKNYIKGICIQTVSKKAILTCNAKGNLS